MASSTVSPSAAPDPRRIALFTFSRLPPDGSGSSAARNGWPLMVPSTLGMSLSFLLTAFGTSSRSPEPSSCALNRRTAGSLMAAGYSDPSVKSHASDTKRAGISCASPIYP